MLQFDRLGLAATSGAVCWGAVRQGGVREYIELIASNVKPANSTTGLCFVHVFEILADPTRSFCSRCSRPSCQFRCSQPSEEYSSTPVSCVFASHAELSSAFVFHSFYFPRRDRRISNTEKFSPNQKLSSTAGARPRPADAASSTHRGVTSSLASCEHAFGVCLYRVDQWSLAPQAPSWTSCRAISGRCIRYS